MYLIQLNINLLFYLLQVHKIIMYNDFCFLYLYTLLSLTLYFSKTLFHIFHKMNKIMV